MSTGSTASSDSLLDDTLKYFESSRNTDPLFFYNISRSVKVTKTPVNHKGVKSNQVNYPKNRRNTSRSSKHGNGEDMPLQTSGSYGLRVPIISSTPGYVGTAPRSLILRPPTDMLNPNSLSSWRNFLKTPKSAVSPIPLLGNIKLNVTESIREFLEEMDVGYPSRARSNSSYFTPMSTMPIVKPKKASPVTNDGLILICVSGEDFYVRRFLLQKYPNTLLGSDEIEEYYNNSLHCYFFDRNRFVFEYIIQFYHTGGLSVHPKMDREAVSMELKFFKITYNNIGLNHSISHTTAFGYNKGLDIGKKDNQQEIIESFTNNLSMLSKCKLRLYLFLMNPQSSKIAMIWMFGDIIFVLLSLVFLIVQSEETLNVYFQSSSAYAWCYWIATGTEIASQIFFTIDFFLRLIAWPKLNKFFRNPINLCDFLSLLPFYIPQLISLVDNNDVKTLVVLRVIRMFRITRIFRIIKHSHGLLIVFHFLFQSAKEILLLASLFTILTLITSSIMYFLEQIPYRDQNTRFISIPASAWWAVVTLTGIGYGDMIPSTLIGQTFGAITLLSGMIFLALPMTIIITKFTKHMNNNEKVLM